MFRLIGHAPRPTVADQDPYCQVGLPEYTSGGLSMGVDSVYPLHLCVLLECDRGYIEGTSGAKERSQSSSRPSFSAPRPPAPNPLQLTAGATVLRWA